MRKEAIEVSCCDAFDGCLKVRTERVRKIVLDSQTSRASASANLGLEPNVRKVLGALKRDQRALGRLAHQVFATSAGQARPSRPEPESFICKPTFRLDFFETPCHSLSVGETPKRFQILFNTL